MTNPGPGSHNRNTHKAMEHLTKSVNLSAPCGCLLHKDAQGQPTLLSKTAFNRQGSGIQSMCRDGKTLIDGIKHQFWRAAHAILLDAIAAGTFDTPTWATILTMPTVPPAGLATLRAVRRDPAIQAFERSLATATTTFTLYLHASRVLERTLTLKNLGLYSLGFANEATAKSAWDALVTTLKSITSIAQLNTHAARFSAMVGADDQRYLVKESARKGTYHPAEALARNWSKMNTLYVMDPNGNVVDSGLRGPFHNTMMKANGDGVGDRAVRLLTEMRRNEGPTEVRAFIKANRAPGMHADHIIPLALGGRHTSSNLAFVAASVNLDKSDTLTYEAYAQVMGQPEGWSMVNGDAFVVLRAFYEEIGMDPILFAQKKPHIEGELRRTVETRIAQFAAASDEDKRSFLAKARPDLNASMQTRFMERFARKRPQ